MANACTEPLPTAPRLGRGVPVSSECRALGLTAKGAARLVCEGIIREAAGVDGTRSDPDQRSAGIKGYSEVPLRPGKRSQGTKHDPRATRFSLR